MEIFKLKRILFFLFVFLSTVVYSQQAENNKCLFFDDFENLENWIYVKQPLVKNETKYSIVRQGTKTALKCESNNSASSLQSKYNFNVYEYPIVRWRWKTDQLLLTGDIRKKKTEDAPLRIYVNFSYNKETADAGYKFRYNFVKNTYGLEIPQFSLVYVIESREQEEEIYDSPFDPGNSKIIIKRSGKKDEGKWFEEEINILDDYKRAFGKEPQKDAYIGIMCDTDNTKESTTSFLDYIGVYAE